MLVDCHLVFFFFFFQAEDGIRDLVRSRGLGDVYKRQVNRYKFSAGLLDYFICFCSFGQPIKYHR